MTQEAYMELLFQECGIDARAKRNDYLSMRAGREVKYISDLNSYERRQIINELRMKRPSGSPSEAAEE